LIAASIQQGGRSGDTNTLVQTLNVRYRAKVQYRECQEFLKRVIFVTTRT